MTPDLFTVAAEPVARAATKATRGKRVVFYVYDCPDGSARIIKPADRDAWALGELIFAGAAGCTPIDNPGVFKLKHVYGLNIESITEMHGGDYAGKHARYVLRSRVLFVEPADAARHGGGQ
jgi:hypothetical protein